MASPRSPAPRSVRAYIAFVDAYRRAADALRAHRTKCDFPEGCVLPMRAFCDPPAAAT